MNNFIFTLICNACMLLLAMSILWLLSVKRHDASIADPFWGTGFVAVAWFSAWLNNFSGRNYVLILASVWGLRLSLHLLVRNHQAAEDPRYQDMRRQWGTQFWWVSYFTVFLLQATLLWAISLPLQLIATYASPGYLTAADYAGIAVWSIGFFFEAVGDYQLTQFRKRKRSKDEVLDTGLWRYTRHPNYFGDSMVWWGFGLIACKQPHGGWGLLSSFMMLLLLMRVSGVPLLEKSLTRRRAGYSAYVARTSAFFPWPPAAKQ